MQADVVLRDVIEGDLLIFFEHQRESEGNRMAAFPPRDSEAFFRHWAKILADDAVVKKTILCDGEIAGNIVGWQQSGTREVGYWIGKQYWGRGIASQALQHFLGYETTRPLHACVAKHNLPSIRVLEKCGFRQVGEIQEFSRWGDQVVEGVILELSEFP